MGRSALVVVRAGFEGHVAADRRVSISRTLRFDAEVFGDGADLDALQGAAARRMLRRLKKSLRWVVVAI